MPVTLRGLNETPTSDTLYSLSEASLSSAGAIGAGVANATVQSLKVLPFNFKIRKVVIYVPSIDAVAGGDSFNLVVGSGAYTQGNIAPNDTFDTSGVNAVTAVAGNCVFANDVPFNSANTAASNTAYTPGNLIGQAPPNVGWLSLATTGGSGIFVPTNWDAVYPAGIQITLRVTTVASTGSIGAGAQVVMAIVPVGIRRAVAGDPLIAQSLVLPGVDY
jgi:hypothetical protein